MNKKYGVSQIPLRKALRILSVKGLFITKHGEVSFINYSIHCFHIKRHKKNIEQEYIQCPQSVF
ncbi:MAG: GntR family transcriptional regulator [Clostridium sp.]|nr:GntR family transcriptional regulator [Clostridium sp.]